MKVLWAAAGEQDRAVIMQYISLDNPLAAIRMDELFTQAARRLAAQGTIQRTIYTVE